jgi:hypothetical protein
LVIPEVFRCFLANSWPIVVAGETAKLILSAPLIEKPMPLHSKPRPDFGGGPPMLAVVILGHAFKPAEDDCDNRNYLLITWMAT